MKYLVVILSSIIITSAVAVAQTDSVTPSRTTEFVLSAGTALPYLPSPFKDFWKSGLSFAVGYGMSLDHGSLGYGSVLGTVEFNSFPFDREGFIAYKQRQNVNLTGKTIEGKATSILAIMPKFKGTFSQDKNSIAPYFTLGIGFLTVTSGEITVNGSIARPKETRSGLAYLVGAGADIPAGDKLTVFVEGDFLMGFTSEPGRQYFPIRAGVRIQP